MANKGRKLWEDYKRGSGYSAASSSQTQSSRKSSSVEPTVKSRGQEEWEKFKASGGLDSVFSTSVVDDFVRDSQAYMQQAGQRLQGMDWAKSKDQNAHKAWLREEGNLQRRYSEANAFLRNNAGSFDQGKLREIQSYFDQFDSNFPKVKDSYRGGRDFYDQFQTEKEYSDYAAQQEDLQNKRNLDIKAYEKEIADLEKSADSIEYDWTNAASRKEAEAEIKRIQDEVYRRKTYLNQAKAIQEKERLSSVANPESKGYDPEFETKREYESTEAENFWGKLTSQYNMGYADLAYEYINRKEMREEINKKSTAYNRGAEESPFQQKGYDHLTDGEIDIYNYYYAKGGKQAAQKYLDSIQEDLNYRKAAAMYAKMEGKTGLEMLHGVEAGLDQFASGIKGAAKGVMGDESYTPPTATQIASGMVRQDLEDTGWKLPQALGGASLGQVGYDAITTTTNMVPSILGATLANAVVPGSGAFVGNALMGASAAGNAYTEAIQQGHSKDQARAYAAAMGGSEVAMQYALGGISKLGGVVSDHIVSKTISKALAGVENGVRKAALELGGKVASEALEEGVQEVLTPVFQNLFLHADADVDWSEVAYSAILGGLTAGVLEGPSVVGNAMADSGHPAEPGQAQQPRQDGGMSTAEKPETPQAAPTVTAPQDTSQQELAQEESPAAGGDIQKVAAKFGKQAKAVEQIYRLGGAEQDVDSFERAFSLAHEMGRSGVSEDYTIHSPATQTLTEQQRRFAWQTGQAAGAEMAQTRSARNAAAVNGKTGWHKGVVKGQDVNIADMAKAFNDPQKKAYKYLSSIAEVTGVDIVLYKSQVGEDGKYQGAQGKFMGKENTIYIDINAGLKSYRDAQSLSDYTMMRTFDHEFTHFVEKWDPEGYNGLRETVFSVMEENGTDVGELIERTAARTGLTYEQASREVIAEAMTDILPDSTFLEQLAKKHQNVFQQLLSKLKEFIADVKAHFKAMTAGTKEARALKQQLEETVSYMESVVRKFDEAAVKAVESYQQTVAEEETIRQEETVQKETAQEEKAEEARGESKREPKEETPKANRSENGYTIQTNAQYGTLEVSFDSKPPKDVLDTLKDNKFRWNGKRKLWYGKANQTAIQNALDAAYQAAAKPAEQVAAVAEKSAQAAPAPGKVEEKKEELTFEKLSIKKADWEARDIVWTAPDRKTPIAYSTVASMEMIEALCEDNPKATIKELIKKVNYDLETKKVLHQYIAFGFGDENAKAFFGKNLRNDPNSEYTYREPVKEEPANGESKNGTDGEAVLQPAVRGAGAARLLDGVESQPVQPGGEGRGSVPAAREQGTADAGRDRQPDAAGPASERGEGDRLGGDLQQLPELKDPEQKQEEPQSADQQLKEEVRQKVEEVSTVEPKGSNFVIGDSLHLPSGTKARTKANIEAIRIVKNLIRENRFATATEQEALSKYVGWGGLADAFGKPVSNRQTRKLEYEPVAGLEKEFSQLKEILTEEEYKAARESTKNAHYTSVEVIRGMYDGLKHLGFTGGRMLEPSSGVGNFVGAMPGDMTSQVKSWTMVELDNITGHIAKYLYPHSDVRIQGFEQTNLPDGYMDVAIGNVPFGNYAISDKSYPKTVTNSIHNYFFAKALDKVRPGGLVMFITSHYTMDARDSAVRKYIMARADLLGAVRLPNNAFSENAGTSVVSDILILKKRREKTSYTGQGFESVSWTNLGGVGVSINEYFKNHPEMILGKVAMGRGMYGSNEMTVNPFPDKGPLGQQVGKAISSITEKMEYSAVQTPEQANFQQARAKKRNQRLTVKDGVVQVKDEQGNLRKLDVDAATAKRISGMVGIRDANTALCDALQQGQKETVIQELRNKLNQLYDSFVKENGYLNAPANKKAINSFADRYSILSLENYTPKDGKNPATATKADIFSRNTVAANRTAAKADTVAEGLTISLNTKGTVDAGLIARLTGEKVESVTRQMIDQRLVFKDKDGNLIPAVQYLSGNVRAKLRQMEGLEGIDPDYRNNVEALREVVPETVAYTDIYVNPGATWVPTAVYEGFVGYILDRSNYQSWRTGKRDFQVEYVSETNEYKVAINDPYAKTSARNTQVWGESGKTFAQIFENMLNGRRTNVYKTDADGNRVLDRAKTEAVAEKAEKLTAEFQKWLWQDEKRRVEMQELYNESYNALVTPKYSGENLTVNGLNAAFTLRPHQKDAVARILNSGGNTLLAHRVGAGKTLEMAAAAMKLKQLGVIKKPMFVVPNNVVAQWGKEFKEYFPAANILVVGDEDMTKDQRMTTISRIKNNDYDAVILAYTKFEKIPMTTAWREQFYQEQIDNILFAINAERESQSGKSFTVKELEKKRKQLEGKLKKLTDKEKDEEGAMFEDLGVDALFVDEAHNFKNLEYTTRMNNVSGLGNADGSQRAFDLYTKVRYLQQLNGGRGIVFATATPVMNSMTEMYIMQRYLQPDTLQQLGIDNFDSWAKMFGEVVNSLEIAPSGVGYRVKQTFSKFKNVKSLQQLFRSFTDVMTEIPGLKIPKMKGGKVQIVECMPGEFQESYMKELAERAENVKGVDPSEDNMLKITSDGRKISYSQRMIDPSLPYEESGKIYKCCENVWKVYQESQKTKGTQMIFCDMATPKGSSNKSNSDTDMEEFGSVDMESAQLYDDMKARMIQLGIPAQEIAFIHDAKNDKQKAGLAQKMNEGKIRVLIGSTGKMGVGLNAQVKAVAIHHLDAPWRPGDIEQRDGRVFRQKNENEEAYKFVYVTKGSFDSRLWDILERKQKFINQVMNGENVGNEIEDTGDVTLSAAEVKAVASGSPLIMEQVALEKEISKLESLQQAHIAGVNRAKEMIGKDQQRIAMLEKRVSDAKADLKTRKDTYSSEKVFSIRIGNDTFADKKEAGAALAAQAQAKAKEGAYTAIGKFAGFTLRVVKETEGISGLVAGSGNYGFKLHPLNTTYGMNHLISVVEGIDQRLSGWEADLSETRKDLAIQKELASAPFDQQDVLKQKRSRYREVMDELNPPKEQQNVSEEDVQYQARRRSSEEDYRTDGVHWAVEAGVMSRSEARVVWEAIANADKRGYYYPETEYGDKFVSSDNALFIVDTDYHNPVVKKVIRFDESYGVNSGYAKELIINARGNPARHRESMRALEDYYGEGYALEYSYGEWRSNAGKERRREGTDSERVYPEDSEQYQLRNERLSDREVLETAASAVDPADLDEKERNALDIFQRKLDAFHEMQDKRLELGRLYKQQQFGPNVDREEAAKTRARMQTMDDAIARANEKLLEVEETAVLRQVLKKARVVVEQAQKAHDDEILKRWRDRRNDSAAIQKYRKRIYRDVQTMIDWVLKPSGKDILKHVPDALKNTVIPFLNCIDFTSKRRLNGGEATKADEILVERMEKLRDELVSGNKINLEEMYYAYDLPPKFLERLDRFIEAANKLVKEKNGTLVINQMTSQELKDLADTVSSLKTLIANTNKFHANAVFQHVSDASEDTIGTLAPLPADSGEYGELKNFLLWEQMRPAYGFERFGKGGKAIYDGLRRGQAKLAFNARKILDFAEKTYTKEEVQKWSREVLKIELEDGETLQIPVAAAMALYELSKRKQAFEHILGGGIRVAAFQKDGKTVSDAGHKVTFEDVARIQAALTDRQKEVADKLQGFMQEQGGQWGNYVSMARFGEKLFGEEHYFPINSDGRHLQATADEKGGAGLYSLLNMGFTKETTPGARNRIIVYNIFDVFANHMASMAQYNAMALPVLDAVKWFNYQQKTEVQEKVDGKLVTHMDVEDSVRDELSRVYGTFEEKRPGSGKKGFAETFILNILRGYNGTEAQGSPMDSMGLKLLHTYNRAQVAYNLRVVIQQPLAVTRAGLLLDANSILRGMKMGPKAVQRNIQEMQHHSGIAAWKALGFYDVNISRGLTSLIKQEETFSEKVTEVGMKGAELADNLTWAAIWNACKEQVRRKGTDPSSAGYMDQVVQLFEDVIYKTQVVDSILTKNEFMRDKGYFGRSVSSFMSEPTTTASMLVSAYDQYYRDLQSGMSRQQAWKKNRGTIARTAAVYGLGALVLAAATAAADGLRDDDDYQEYGEKWQEAFWENLLEELSPFNKLPLVSDVWELAKELVGKFTGTDLYGNAPQSVIMQWYDVLSKSAEIFHDKLFGEQTNYTWYAGIYKLLQAASGISGYPLAALTREIVTAWNNIIGAMAPSLKVKTYDPGPEKNIRYAYQDGYLTEEEATRELLGKGLADTENEAYWKVRDWETDGSRYDALYEAVLAGQDITELVGEFTEHGYSNKEISNNIRDQIGEWCQEGKISKQRATELVGKYTDLTKVETTKIINQWSAKVVTGVAYGDIKEAYLGGQLSKRQAVDMYVRFGGMERQQAREKVEVWEFVKRYPECEGISYSAIAAYREFGSGMSAKTFYDVWKYESSVSADVDANGKAISGSKKRKVLDYINRQNLTVSQKDGLYYAFGWAESKISEAPWH